MYDQKDGYGYGKRPMWQWILLYVVVGGIIYYGIYYFMFGKNGGYAPAPVNPNTTTQPVATTPTTTTASQNSNLAAAPIVLTAQTSATLGTYLVATNGMTLYESAKDTSDVSNCSGGCATAWPPYVVSVSTLGGGAGVTGSIATITRANGTKQITYNGMPLYFWQGDTKAGDATGQNVNGFSVVKL
jgi:predicted lipoprotein with Yx(FWY)xxD motif